MQKQKTDHRNYIPISSLQKSVMFSNIYSDPF